MTAPDHRDTDSVEAAAVYGVYNILCSPWIPPGDLVIKAGGIGGVKGSVSVKALTVSLLSNVTVNCLSPIMICIPSAFFSSCFSAVVISGWVVGT